MNHLTHILTGFCLVVQSFCLLRQAWFFGSFYHEMRDVLRELKEVVAELKAMTPGALAESRRKTPVCISRISQDDQEGLDLKGCRQEQKKTPCFSEKSPMKGEFQNENPRHRDTDETVQES